MTRTLMPLLLTLPLLAPPAPAADGALDLPLGDPARREKHATLVLDGITDTRSGAVLSPAELAQRLAGVRLLFVGESHTSAEFHRAQLQVIRELKKAGRRVLVGLEMYPATEQKVLDQWNAGALEEEAFVASSRWYKSWGYHWGYYRDIFLLAKEQKIPLHGVNVPREVISNVRKHGINGVTPEERGYLPLKVDTASEEHRKLFRAFFDEGDSMHSMALSEEMWEGLYVAQCAWDASMAWNAVKALEKDGTPDAIMVVLIGAGHAAYGLGAERQAALWFQGKTASVIPIPVLDEKDQAPKVRASYADFVWGVAKETDPLYPVLGTSSREGKAGAPPTVIDVQKDSVAEAAGFKVGDQILSMDGTPLKDRETVNRLMAGKRWSDTAVYQVKRGGETLTLTARFQRKAPAPKS